MKDSVRRWRFTRKLTGQEWQAIREMANQMMGACPEYDSKGRPLRNVILTIRRGATGSSMVFLDHSQPRIDEVRDDGQHHINFIGAQDFAETFSMTNTTSDKSVNTFGQPYDDLVLGLFVLIKDSYEDLLEVGTGPDLEDWGRGLRVARTVNPSARISSSLVMPKEPEVRLDLSAVVIDRPATLDFRG